MNPKSFFSLKFNESKEEKKESTIPEFKSPKELSDWMKKNIKYKEFSKLMTPEEVYKEKKGSCHDQVCFEWYVFHKMKVSCNRLFLIEHDNKPNEPGGRTHTLLYYMDDEKLFWFENAWGGQEGIHGPYDSLSALKKEVKELMLKDSKYKFVEFAPVKTIKFGMTLQEYVEACLG